MHMVGDPANDDRLAIQSGENAAEVTVEFIAQVATTQEWSSIFGREHRMHEDLGERLRHDCTMRTAGL